MVNLLIFILASWGMTHILVSGKIFESFRNWIIIKSVFLGDLISCYQCMGFWAGMFIIGCFTRNPAYIVLFSFLASGTTSFINSVFVWINTSIRKNQEDINKTS